MDKVYVADVLKRCVDSDVASKYTTYLLMIRNGLNVEVFDSRETLCKYIVEDVLKIWDLLGFDISYNTVKDNVETISIQLGYENVNQYVQGILYNVFYNILTQCEFEDEHVLQYVIVLLKPLLCRMGSNEWLLKLYLKYLDNFELICSRYNLTETPQSFIDVIDDYFNKFCKVDYNKVPMLMVEGELQPCIDKPGLLWNRFNDVHYNSTLYDNITDPELKNKRLVYAYINYAIPETFIFFNERQATEMLNFFTGKTS